MLAGMTLAAHDIVWSVSLYVKEHIFDQLEEGCLVISLFLDLSKAFECLIINLPLYKLNSLVNKDSIVILKLPK